MANLVGGFNHLEKYEFVNGKDYPIYEMENNIHVWNHQPAVSSPEATPRKTGKRAPRSAGLVPFRPSVAPACQPPGEWDGDTPT